MEWLAYKLSMTFSWCLSLGSVLSSEKGEEVRQGVDGAGDHGHGLVGSRLRHHRFFDMAQLVQTPRIYVLLLLSPRKQMLWC